MEALIAALTREHAAEAALLWSLWDEDRADDGLRQRIALHLRGCAAGRARGADPLAGLPPPWCGGDWLPAAWLGAGGEPADDDAAGRRAVADAAAFAGPP